MALETEDIILNNNNTGSIEVLLSIHLDFRLFGYHKKEYFDSYGDLHKIEYYKNYDIVNDVYTNLVIKEDRVYSRSSTSGLLETRATTITWYNIEGDVNTTKENITKYYSAKKGFVANKRARRNLIDNASMFLYASLMQNNSGDAAQSEIEVEDFEDLTNLAQSKYINSNTNPLITIITESADVNTDNYRSYITVAMRDSLLSILNISYV